MKRYKQKKPRNWHALNAIQRHAGAHKGSKAEQNKQACRKPIDEELDHESTSDESEREQKDGTDSREHD